ncbi:AAA family ATPase [Sorangium sp. So ce363]
MNGFIDEVTLFSRNFFSVAFKDNLSLEGGVLRVSRENLFSGLNNVIVSSILSDRRYATCFGFTEVEVASVLDQAWSDSVSAAQPTTAVREELGEVTASLATPNLEVRVAHRDLFRSWLRRGLPERRHAEALIRALLGGDAPALEALIERLLVTVMSYQDPAGREPEKLYHGFILGLLVSSRAITTFARTASPASAARTCSCDRSRRAVQASCWSSRCHSEARPRSRRSSPRRGKSAIAVTRSSWSPPAPPPCMSWSRSSTESAPG